jgi:hypothetical protein
MEVQIVHEPLSQKTHHKSRAGGVAERVGPEFKPQYWKKRKNEDEDDEDEGGQEK